MSGQTDRIYKEKISMKAMEIYTAIFTELRKSPKRISEICSICRNFSMEDVEYALEQLVSINLLTYSAETRTYDINHNKNIRVFRG